MEKKRKKNNKPEHSTIIEGGCPECGGDVHDGTGTGWEICQSCTWMG